MNLNNISHVTFFLLTILGNFFSVVVSIFAGIFLIVVLYFRKGVLSIEIAQGYSKEFPESEQEEKK